MVNANDVRRAHALLDDISIGNQPNEDDLNHLRSFLPDLPAQKTLEELLREVYDAWVGTNENEWPDDIHGDLEAWLAELHSQLQGLKDIPAAVPALPAGIRLADHAEHGRVVVSPQVDIDGDHLIFFIDERCETGCDYKWVYPDTLTFIDSEPAAPIHPEFLETEADYTNAPDGTVVAAAGSSPVMRSYGVWESATHMDRDAKIMAGESRFVLRWGWGNE